MDSVPTVMMTFDLLQVIFVLRPASMIIVMRVFCFFFLDWGGDTVSLPVRVGEVPSVHFICVVCALCLHACVFVLLWS